MSELFVPHAQRAINLPPIDDPRKHFGDVLLRHVVTSTVAVFGIVIALTAIGTCTISVVVAVDGAGFLEPVRTWPVRSLEDGSVASVLVQTGDTVRAGQLLVRLDSLTLTGDLIQTRAQYAEQALEAEKLAVSAPVQLKTQAEARALAEAHLIKARAALIGDMVNYSLGNNVDSLLQRYVAGTHVNLDLAVSDVLAAESELRSAAAGREMEGMRPFDIHKQQAEVNRLRADISTTLAHLHRLDIRAPAAGVVLTEQLERLPGSLVHVGDQLLEVADPGAWRATMQVSEQDIHQVAPGDSAVIDVPALKNLNIGLLRGAVSTAALESTNEAPTTATTGQAATATVAPGTYRVEIAIDRAQLRSVGIDYFRRGYSATAKIFSRRERIITLIRDYLFEKTPRMATVDAK
jgi:HlyD family secretion protein